MMTFYINWQVIPQVRTIIEHAVFKKSCAVLQAYNINILLSCAVT